MSCEFLNLFQARGVLSQPAAECVPVVVPGVILNPQVGTEIAEPLRGVAVVENILRQLGTRQTAELPQIPEDGAPAPGMFGSELGEDRQHDAVHRNRSVLAILGLP